VKCASTGVFLGEAFLVFSSQVLHAVMFLRRSVLSLLLQHCNTPAGSTRVSGLSLCYTRQMECSSAKPCRRPPSYYCLISFSLLLQPS